MCTCGRVPPSAMPEGLESHGGNPCGKTDNRPTAKPSGPKLSCSVAQVLSEAGPGWATDPDRARDRPVAELWMRCRTPEPAIKRRSRCRYARVRPIRRHPAPAIAAYRAPRASGETCPPVRKSLIELSILTVTRAVVSLARPPRLYQVVRGAGGL